MQVLKKYDTKNEHEEENPALSIYGCCNSLPGCGTAQWSVHETQQPQA